MKRLAYILFALFLCSLLNACGIEQPGGKPLQSDPAFAPYVTSFQTDSIANLGVKQNLSNLTIKFENLDVGLSGQCIVSPDKKTKVIKIDPSWWNAQADNYLPKQALLYHELGHCVLNRGHKNDTIVYAPVGEIYASIMNPYSSLDATYYNDHKAYYINELFH